MQRTNENDIERERERKRKPAGYDQSAVYVLSAAIESIFLCGTNATKINRTCVCVRSLCRLVETTL